MTQLTSPSAHAFMPHNAPGAVIDAGRENLDLFGGAFFEAAGRALTTALNRPLSVQVFEAVSMALHEVLADMDPPWVFVEITYQRGMTGTHWIIASRRNASGAGRRGRSPTSWRSRPATRKRSATRSTSSCTRRRRR